MSARFFRAPLLITAGAVLAAAPAVVTFGQELASVASSANEQLAARIGEGIGPPGAEVRSLALAPSDPNRLYLGTDNGHLYRSRDGARTWELSSLRLDHVAVVDNLLVHPTDPERLFVAYWEPSGTGGLIVTSDGGDSWESAERVLGRPSLRAIAMAPSRPDTLYVGGIGGVWRSDDAGASWRNVNGVGLATDFIESLAIDPRDPEVVYAGTWRQVYRSQNGGERWRRVYAGMALDRDVFSISISPHDPDTVFAGTCNFLYCSRDGGSSWGERRQGLARTHNRVHAILPDPRDPQVVYAGTRGGLYRSDDGGTAWQLIESSITVSALALDPASGRLFVGTEERGVLVDDGGPRLVEHNVGLASSRVAAFDTLPGAPRVMFAARRDAADAGSVHYSTDFGTSWSPLGRNVAPGEIVALRAQIEPVNRVVVVGTNGWYSVTPGGRWAEIPAPPGAFADLGRATSDGRFFALTSEGVFAAEGDRLSGQPAGVATAFDAAPAWRSVWSGSGPTRLRSSADGSFLALGEGVTVRGAWPAGGQPSATVSVPTGIEGQIVDLAGHEAEPDSAYAITPDHVYRSTDRGESWSLLPLPWRVGDLRAVAVDPGDPARVIVLDYRGAIYRGHDHGQHWLILDADPGLHRAWSLHLPASAPGYALVATQGHGLRVVGLDPLALPAVVPPVAAPEEEGGSRHDPSSRLR